MQKQLESQTVVPQARRVLMALGAMIVAASIACTGTAVPTQTAVPSPTAQAVEVLTPGAVTSTPPTPPTAVIQPATATPTVVLNGGTETASPAGTLETDCINTYLPVGVLSHTVSKISTALNARGRPAPAGR